MASFDNGLANITAQQQAQNQPGEALIQQSLQRGNQLIQQSAPQGQSGLTSLVGGLKNIIGGGSPNRSVIPQGNMQVRQPTSLGPSNPNPGPMPMTVPQ